MKKFLSKGKALVLGAVGVASASLSPVMAQQAEIKAAMDSIKADAVANVNVMLPAGIGIIGVIVGATIAIVVFKKITGKIG